MDIQIFTNMIDFFKDKLTIICSLVSLCVVLIIVFALKVGRIPILRNCWFCNNNNWVPFPLRNSWVCQKCQQYNGFTSDGDYNRPLQFSNTYNFHQTHRSPKLLPSNNGLCHRCNTNQELKVMQLANFKPMNDKNFNSEIEAFTVHLENVYKLCSECKKYVNMKLQKEKGFFLVPRKSPAKHKIKRNFKLSSVFNVFRTCIGFILRFLSFVLLISIVTDICLNAEVFLSRKMIRIMKQHYQNMHNVLNSTVIFNDNVINYVSHYKEGVVNLPIVNYATSLLPSDVFSMETAKTKLLESFAATGITVVWLSQLLTSSGLCLQFSLFLSQFGRSLRCLFNLIMWVTSYYISQSGDKYLQIFQVLFAGILVMNSKVSFVAASDDNKNKHNVSKKMKNLSSSSVDISSVDMSDQLSDDSDVDIGCNRTSTPDFHSNHTNYFSQTGSQFPEMLNSSSYSVNARYDLPIENGFPRSNPFLAKPFAASPLNVRHRNFYSNASDLDESISTLNLGKNNNWSHDRSHVFSTRQYNSTSPNIFMCSPAPTVRRPVLSPSRFTHGTQQSWVAGGYWGTESPKQLYNVQDTSRSSSQSSGFESLPSGTYRPGNAFPPSREDHFTNECGKKADSVFCDRSTYYGGSLQSAGAFQNFPSRCSGGQSNAPPYKPMFVPNRPSDCTLRLQNMNLLNEFQFLTPNNSFKPLERPSS